MENFKIPIIIGIFLIIDYYDTKEYKRLKEENNKLNEKYNKNIMDYQIYKNFVIKTKLSEKFEKYKKDVEIYNHFKQIGNIKYKENIKNKYYVVDELFGETEFDLPYDHDTQKENALPKEINLPKKVE